VKVTVKVTVLVEVAVTVREGEGVALGRGVRVGEGVRVGSGVLVEVVVNVGLWVLVSEGVKLRVEVTVKVAVAVTVLEGEAVAVGRRVRVGEAVQVGGGVRVGLRVHVGTGVDVAVGVAESASKNACFSAVWVAAVARKRLSGVEVGGGTVVVVAVGVDKVCEAVADGGEVGVANVSIGAEVGNTVAIPGVGVNAGISVFTRKGVRVKDEARGGVGEKIWFATGLPYTAEATVSARSTKEAISHWRPATIRSLRVRKKTTVRAA
jgi:hypothetical protein